MHVSTEERPNRLKERRRGLGMTHAQLACAAGTSRNSIGMIERGQQEPGVELARRIARALDTTVDELFGN